MLVSKTYAGEGKGRTAPKPVGEHHPTLSPSSLPAKAHCIHYKSKPAGKSSDRGTRIHEETAMILRGFGSGNVLMEEAAEAAAAEWCAEQVKEIFKGGDIRGIEQKVTLYEPGSRGLVSTVTYGTVDCWGYDRKGNLTLVDFKTGEERDYEAQFAVYALALMEQENKSLCRVVVLYADQKLSVEGGFSYDDAHKEAYGVINRVRAGTEPPQENDYCNWCAKKSTCPVWVKPASDALATVNIFGRLAQLRDDPERLGMFLAQWKKAEALVAEADLKEHAKALLEEGVDVPGWQLQHRKGRSSYDMEALKDVWADRMGSIPVPLKTGPTIRALVQIKPSEKARLNSNPGGAPGIRGIDADSSSAGQEG